MKKFIFLCFAICPLLHAGSYTANSCNYHDVNACVNSDSGGTCVGGAHTAVDGDIINIPAGSCTWSTGLTVPNAIGITIKGVGTPNSGASTTGASSSCGANTIITVSGGIRAFNASPSFGNSTMRFSCMQVTPGTGGGIAFSVLGTCTSSGCPNLRLDNIDFTGWDNHPNVGISYGINAVGDMFGVMDHNTISGGTASTVELVENSNASYLGVGQWGDNAWHAAPAFGSANFLFVENNTFTDAGTSENEGSAGSLNNEGGGKIVARFNTYAMTGNQNTAMAWHGTESNGRPRSTAFYEFYENTFSCNSTVSGCTEVVGPRGGTGMLWGNSLSSTTGSYSTAYLIMNTYRTQGDPNAKWGPCDGSSVFDTNDGTTYFSGTVATITGENTFTVSGSPGWTSNQWVPAASLGAPYSIHDVTATNGSEISANGTNNITFNDSGGPGQFKMCDTTHNIPPGCTITPNSTGTIGDTVQILRATVCIDQAGGRGIGTLYSGDPPTPNSAASQTLTPTYLWLTTVTGPNSFGSGADTGRVIQNREWYTENPNQAIQSNSSTPFDGTTTIGMGHGTTANRPSTCTTGVGYWNTTEGGTWNNGTANSGALDLCTATNTWTSSYYTPYTYPHPLDSGANTYYVSTTGNDSTGTGSISAPWATITHASTITLPGDTVIVEDGTYTIPAGGSCGGSLCGDWSISSSGTAGNVITYMAQDKWKAKLVGQGTGDGSVVLGAHGSYNLIENFDITGTDAGGIMLATTGTPTNNTATGNYVHDLTPPCDANGGAGLNTGGGSAYTGVSNHSFYSNFVVNIQPVGGSGCGVNTTSGIYEAVPGGTVANNIVINSWYNFQSWHAASNLTIFGNTLINGKIGLIIGSGDSGAGTNDNDIVQNNIIDGFTTGLAEETGTGGTIGTHNTYTDNMYFNNTTNSVFINGSCSTCFVGNPLFNNYTGNNQGNYTLLPGSTGLTGGTALAGILTDFYNVSRPQSGTTVVGAAIAQPTQSIVTINAGTTINTNTQRIGINMGSPTPYESGMIYKNYALPQNVGAEYTQLIQAQQIQSGAGSLSTTTAQSNLNNMQGDGVTANWWVGGNFFVAQSCGANDESCSSGGAELHCSSTITANTVAGSSPNGPVYTFSPACAASLAVGDMFFLTQKFSTLSQIGNSGTVAFETSDVCAACGTQSFSLTGNSSTSTVFWNVDDLNGTVPDKFRLMCNFYNVANPCSAASSFVTKFWAKVVSGTPTVTFSANRLGVGTCSSSAITLSGGSTWTQYTGSFTCNVDSVGTSNSGLQLTWSATGTGAWQMYMDNLDFELDPSTTDPNNTTIFTDEYVHTLQILLNNGAAGNNGTLRYNVNPNSLKLDDWIQPTYAVPQITQGINNYTSYQRTDTLEDYLLLCHVVGADPYIILPVTLLETDAPHLIDFLYGGSGTTYGAKRIALGGPSAAGGYGTWFRTIHMSLGNENWNNNFLTFNIGFRASTTDGLQDYMSRGNTIFTAMRGTASYIASQTDLIGGFQQASPSSTTTSHVSTYMHPDSIEVSAYTQGIVHDTSSNALLFGPALAEPYANLQTGSIGGIAGWITDTAATTGCGPSHNIACRLNAYEQGPSPLNTTMTQAQMNGFPNGAAYGVIEANIAMLDGENMLNTWAQNDYSLAQYYNFISSLNMPIWGTVVDMGGASGLTNKANPPFFGWASPRPRLIGLYLDNQAIVGPEINCAWSGTTANALYNLPANNNNVNATNNVPYLYVSCFKSATNPNNYTLVIRNTDMVNSYPITWGTGTGTVQPVSATVQQMAAPLANPLADNEAATNTWTGQTAASVVMTTGTQTLTSGIVAPALSVTTIQFTTAVTGTSTGMQNGAKLSNGTSIR